MMKRKQKQNKPKTNKQTKKYQVRNSSVNTKVREGGGRERAAGARAEIPAACGEDHVEAGCSPVNIMEDYAGADILTVACRGLHAAGR